MIFGAGEVAVMEGVRASAAAIDALFVEDAALDSGTAAGGGVDVLQRRYELRLDRMHLVSRLEAQVAAIKARDAAEASEMQQAMLPPEAPAMDRVFAEMSAVEEMAGVLTISSVAAGAFVHQARQLCSLPPAMDALAAGAMSWQHARVIADEIEDLGPAAAAGLVAHFLDPDAPHPARRAAPGELVPSRFRHKVRTWRERHHPESLEKRHAKSVADRRVEHCRDRDGMAWISAYLPADTASAIWNRTSALARGKQGPAEARTLPQLRADEFATALLSNGSNHGSTSHNVASSADDGTSGQSVEAETVPAPRADVLVTVPVLALLGLTDEPAMLDGHGPIPASMARKLVADGGNSFYRVLVDPRDGAPLEIGRKSYRLPEAVKRWLRLRDGRCTFPGCSNHSLDNETDHLLAWHRGGTTGVSNLGQACPKHHRIKHTSAWRPTPATKDHPPGWTSPTGRHYTSEHPDWEPPEWPEILGVPEMLNAGACPPKAILSWEPPLEEPPADNLLDLDDIPADDPIWEDFYALPNVLPQDPLRDWKLALS